MSKILMFFFIFILFLPSAQAYFIGGTVAFVLEALIIGITFLVFFIKKMLNRKDIKNQELLENDKEVTKNSDGEI